MYFLVLNVGSSSVKCSLFDFTGTPPETATAPLWEAEIDWHSDGDSQIVTTTTPQGQQQRTFTPTESPIGALTALLPQLWEEHIIARPEQISVVGQRIVYGGEHYYDPVQLTETVREDLSRLTDQAPDHLAHSLEAVSLVEGILGETPQVGIF